jgi:3D (Asp-Asp-Asp) domain-containing protein
MKILIPALLFAFAGHVFGVEQTMLARVTTYWRSEGCGLRASWNGGRLRNGHCAVDPKKIPYGSKVVFPDAICTAVDTGPDVVNRKAARCCAKNQAQRSAIVIDRFFETKEQAAAWTRSHSHFINVRIVGPNERAKLADANPASAKSHAQAPVGRHRIDANGNYVAAD